VGVVTPLIASYFSIAFYLIMISPQHLVMPSLVTMLQLILLTTAHATLMVSAAIVISIQSTSVKAANLLASFIVIPVAILMQGEAVMLFWGNDQVLWLAVAGVMIISLLLIRVGIAHFQREYLLGREIDSFNLHWRMVSACFGVSVAPRCPCTYCGCLDRGRKFVDGLRLDHEKCPPGDQSCLTGKSAKVDQSGSSNA
jgi:hypothetical protein